MRATLEEQVAREFASFQAKRSCSAPRPNRVLRVIVSKEESSEAKDKAMEELIKKVSEAWL